MKLTSSAIGLCGPLDLLAFEGHVAPVGDLDRYLQAIFEVLNAGPPRRPSLIYLAHVALRHRQTQAVLLLPSWLQPVVFRLAVLVGVDPGVVPLDRLARVSGAMHRGPDHDGGLTTA